MTPDTGYSNCTWKLNSKALDVSCSVDAKGVLTFDKTKAKYGNGKYAFTLKAKKDGITYTTNAEYFFDDIITTGKFLLSFDLDEEIAGYCNYADYSVLKNNTVLADYNKLNIDVENASFKIQNNQIEQGSYKLSITFYANQNKTIEVGKYETVFDISTDKITLIKKDIFNDTLIRSESFSYGLWGLPGTDNYENTKYILIGTKLVIFGQGPMAERNENANPDLTDITECYIDDGITTIGEGAFCGATNLTKITGYKDVTKIEKDAFKNVHLTFIPAFNNVTEIGESAFYGNDFETIDGFDAVTTIGKSAFRNCLKLKSIKGFNNLTTFETESDGTKPFYICDESGFNVDNKPALEEVSGFNKVTEFPLSLGYCSNLKKVSGFNSVETVDILSFYYPVTSGGYASKVFLEVIEGFDSLENLDKIVDNGNYFPLGWTSEIKSLSGFAAFEKINNSAFSGCSKLEELSGFNNVTIIGENAFHSCSNLKTFNGFESVTEIGNNAFSDCTGLTEIPVFEKLTKIGEAAFARCYGITKIEGFNKVTSVGSSAFTECCNVTDIIGFNSLVSIPADAFKCSATKSSLKHIKGFNRLEEMPEQLFCSYFIETFEGFQNVKVIDQLAIPAFDARNNSYVPPDFIYYGEKEDYLKITWTGGAYKKLSDALSANDFKKVDFQGKKAESKW